MGQNRVDSSMYEIDWEEKLISDNLMELKDVKVVHCFNEYQAKEIIKRSQYECRMKQLEKGLYEIVRGKRKWN